VVPPGTNPDKAHDALMAAAAPNSVSNIAGLLHA
jgi:hypothetical protein